MVSLTEGDLVRVVDQLVGEGFEELGGLEVMVVSSSCRFGLSWPIHCCIFRMTLLDVSQSELPGPAFQAPSSVFINSRFSFAPILFISHFEMTFNIIDSMTRVSAARASARQFFSFFYLVFITRNLQKIVNLWELDGGIRRARVMPSSFVGNDREQCCHGED